MPYPESHKPRSREKILASAIELFSGRGYDNVTIDEVMAHAGMTRGAFYAHFGSKQQLYSEAIVAAAQRSPLLNHDRGDCSARERLNQLLKGYLSLAHLGNQSTPCPLAFLVTDIANREAEVRDAYTRVYKGFSREIGKLLAEQGDERGDTALALTALMIGGVALGRALNDDKVVVKLLVACRNAGDGLIKGR